MDRYVLAKTAELIRTVTAQMQEFDIPGASESLRAFFELLTNWYVRRSRRRLPEARPEATGGGSGWVLGRIGSDDLRRRPIGGRIFDRRLLRFPQILRTI